MFCFKRGKLKRLLKKANLLSQNRATNTVSDSVLKKEIEMYKKIAAIYDKMIGKSDFPYARDRATECYRLTANMGDVESMRIAGMRFLEDGKFYLSLRTTPFYSDSVHEAGQKRCFGEALAFLNTASSHEDALARRYLGVIYVNGWGVDPDVDKGIHLITNSLDLENAWSKSSEIFAELGLNKPEFFAKLMAMKGN